MTRTTQLVAPGGAMPGAFPRGGVVGLGAAGVGLGAPAAGIAAVRSDATVTSPAGLEAVTETRRAAPASAGPGVYDFAVAPGTLAQPWPHRCH